MISADFNNDGSLDFAVASRVVVSSNDGIEVFLGDGRGSFSSTQQMAVGARGLSAADLNGDGLIDLVAGGSQELVLMLGAGEGQFQDPLMVPVSDITNFLDICVLNADLDTDLDVAALVRKRGGARSIILFVFDQGGVQHQIEHEIGTTSDDGSIRCADMNRDGIDDLVATKQPRLRPTFDDSLKILVGDGDGNFSDLAEVELPGRPRGLLLADVDADNRIDIVTVSGGSLCVLLNPSRGAHATDIGGFTMSTAIQDLDGDSLPDVVTGDTGRRFSSTVGVSVLKNIGNGVLIRIDDIKFGGLPSGVLITDIDSDFTPDLVCTTGGQTIAVGFGDGLCGFTSPFERFETGGQGSRFLDSGDFDGDQRSDVVVGSNSGDVSVFFGEGRRGFSSPLVVSLGAPISGLAIEDVDVDGNQDLLITINDPPRLAVIQGTGTGTLNDPRFFETQASDPDIIPRQNFAVGDINEDGSPDVLVRDFTQHCINVLLGDGLGSFARPVTFPLGFQPRDLALGDLDEDGHLDVLISNQVEVSIFRGDGSGVFMLATRIASGKQPMLFDVADLNLDGHPDVGMVGRDSDKYYVFLNNTFQPNRRHCPRGSVNLAVGAVSDVVFVNDSAGTGIERTVTLDLTSPFQLRVEEPPTVASGQTVPFALYAWRGTPTAADFRVLPDSIGQSCMPMPLTETTQKLKIIWNNTGRAALGRANQSSQPAPTCCN